MIWMLLLNEFISFYVKRMNGKTKIFFDFWSNLPEVIFSLRAMGAL